MLSTIQMERFFKRFVKRENMTLFQMGAIPIQASDFSIQ